MKLLRDVAITHSGRGDLRISGSSTHGECVECGWVFSRTSFLDRAIRHFEECSQFDEMGVIE